MQQQGERKSTYDAVAEAFAKTQVAQQKLPDSPELAAAVQALERKAGELAANLKMADAEVGNRDTAVRVPQYKWPRHRRPSTRRPPSEQSSSSNRLRPSRLWLPHARSSTPKWRAPTSRGAKSSIVAVFASPSRCLSHFLRSNSPGA